MRTRLALAAALSALAVLPGTALADEAASAANVYEQVAPAEQPGTDGATSNLVTVAEGDQAVVDFGGGQQEISIKLPEKTADGGAVTRNGVQVFDGAEGSTIVDASATGAQIATVTPASGATDALNHAYDFDLPADSQLVKQPGGSVEILDEEGQSLATIRQPWARDADGKTLPTTYKVDGDKLTQQVDTSDATFPVVADPSLEWHWYWSPFKVRVWFSYSETRSINHYLAVYGLSYGAVTTACGYIPHWAAKLACQALVLGTAGDFLINVRQAISRRRCLSVDIQFNLARRGLDWNDGGCR